VAKRTALDALRIRRVSPKTLGTAGIQMEMARAPSGSRPSRLVERRDSAAAVRARSDRLTRLERSVFDLRFVHGFEIAEIAMYLNVSVDVVKQRISRARRHLEGSTHGSR
jgi:RNA polymerase sigma factor (sigma-70 family)